MITLNTHNHLLEVNAITDANEGGLFTVELIFKNTIQADFSYISLIQLPDTCGIMNMKNEIVEEMRIVRFTSLLIDDSEDEVKTYLNKGMSITIDEQKLNALTVVKISI